MLVMPLLMLMLMLMLLALTLMLLFNASNAAAYAAANDAKIDAKMPNAACHLVAAYAFQRLPTLLPLRWQLILVTMQC